MQRGEPAIRTVVMPKDTNEAGTIFGGVILSLIDLAGVVEARKTTTKPMVTVAMREVVFVAPVYVGDLVSCHTRTLKHGRTSVTVAVEVWAKRRSDWSQEVRVTDAEIVYVAVDAEGRPTPIEPTEGGHL